MAPKQLLLGSEPYSLRPGDCMVFYQKSQYTDVEFYSGPPEAHRRLSLGTPHNHYLRFENEGGMLGAPGFLNNLRENFVCFVSALTGRSLAFEKESEDRSMAVYRFE